MKVVSIRVSPWGLSHTAKSRQRHISFPGLLINSMSMTKRKRKSRRTKFTPRNFYLGLRIAPKLDSSLIFHLLFIFFGCTHFPVHPINFFMGKKLLRISRRTIIIRPFFLRTKDFAKKGAKMRYPPFLAKSLVLRKKGLIIIVRLDILYNFFPIKKLIGCTGKCVHPKNMKRR